VVQNVTQLGDCLVQAVIEVNKRIFWPNFPAKFFSRDKLASIVKEDLQYTQRLSLQPNTFAISCQFSGAEINLKSSEPGLGWANWGSHCGALSSARSVGENREGR
jgi:hypothetical protein